MVAIYWFIAATFTIQGGAATQLELSNLRLNLTGQILADLTLKQGRAPTGGYADIEFSYSGGGNTVSESVRAMVGPLNVKKPVSTRQVFPCNETLDVTATLKNPGTTPVSTKASITRKCTATSGSPDLTVVEVKRTDSNGGLQSPRETPIRLRITVANVGSNMPFNEQGGTPWIVQVTPGASGSADGGTGGIQSFAMPLSANQRHSFDVYPVALACGKLNPVTVVVDRDRTITESNERNNTVTFNIPGNRCQDA